jgi:hypothetical protein
MDALCNTLESSGGGRQSNQQISTLRGYFQCVRGARAYHICPLAPKSFSLEFSAPND